MNVHFFSLTVPSGLAVAFPCNPCDQRQELSPVRRLWEQRSGFIQPLWRFESPLGSTFDAVERDQIHGIDRILEKADRIIYQCRNFEELNQQGAGLLRGALFHGPVGTGKKMVSRYIATRLDARYVAMRGMSGFGKDDSTTHAIRNIFSEGSDSFKRDGRWVILFWDHFSDQRKETISELIEQVKKQEPGVLLIISTTDLGKIDAEFAKVVRERGLIKFDPPDLQGKRKAFRSSMARRRRAEGIDDESLALLLKKEVTVPVIEEIVQEGWLEAVLSAHQKGETPKLTDRILAPLLLTHRFGPAPNVSLTKEEKFAVAVHEVGHALLHIELDLPFQVITLMPLGGALGKTIGLNPSQTPATIGYVRKVVISTYGGKIASEICGIDPFGVAGDLRTAGEQLARVAHEMGFSRGEDHLVDNGISDYRGGLQDGQLSPWTLREQEEKIRAELKKGRSEAERILGKYERKAIEWLAKALITRGETLTRKEFDALRLEAKKRFGHRR